MSMLSGSGLERAHHCAASLAFPGADQQTEAAEEGTKNHAIVEAGLSNGTIEGMAACVTTLAEGAIDIKVEVAYALDVEDRSCRYIGERKNRDYGPLGHKEIPLTVDAIFEYANGAIAVADWKSRKRVTAAERNWQIRAAAVAVMLHRKADMLDAGIGYLDDGELDLAPFDAFDISPFWDALDDIQQRVERAKELLAAGQTPDVNAGPWCEYCPALPYCPAHTRLALAMLGELTELERMVDELSLEQAGRAWQTVEKFLSMGERIKESLKLRAKREPIPLPFGKIVRLVEYNQRRVDGKEAARQLVERGIAAPFKVNHVESVRVMNRKE